MAAAPRTLRRYIASRFLIAILGTFLLLALIIFMIDFVELLRQSGKLGKVSASSLALIALLRLPAYTEFLLAFTVLVGSIGALLVLNRKSELAVMRASGMSVWQFLRPGVVCAGTLGVLATVAYNPIAATARAEAERQFALTFSKDTNVLRQDYGLSWLRQDGADGQSIIGALAAAKGGLQLTGISVFAFDRAGHFSERIDGASAELRDGHWLIKDAWVARQDREPEKFDTYLVSTYLTPERVQDALGSVLSLTFWELPGLIEVAEKAKLSGSRLRIQYEILLSRPLLCIAMVFLAATVSLRSFRSGGIQTMVLAGMVGGFGFFLLAEVSRQIGVAGLVPPWVAIWLPVALVLALSITVLLHLEDG